MTQDAIIQIRDLVNCFGVQCVHQGLNLDVKRGEVLGVVGGSGTGKSVLLRSIVGLRRPTDGKIHVFGKDLMALSGQSRAMVERRFGVLFQRGALFSSLTVTENVALPLIENADYPGLRLSDWLRLNWHWLGYRRALAVSIQHLCRVVWSSVLR